MKISLIEKKLVTCNFFLHKNFKKIFFCYITAFSPNKNNIESKYFEILIKIKYR